MNKPMKFSTRIQLFGALVLLALPAAAHHSFAIFDSTREVTITGVVADFQWTNPHCWLHVDVVNDEGVTEQWVVEMLSRNVLGRMGWNRSSVMPGDEVTVVLHPVRTGANAGNMVNVFGASGDPIGGPTQ